MAVSNSGTTDTGRTDSKTFLTEHFLLETPSARNLYFQYAADLPLIDYHNHLPPAEIAGDKQFSNLTEIWLKGDHYKWRAMRALGVDENLITGSAGDEEKFLAWAACSPQTIGNPLFHWTQMELKNPFGLETWLNESTAREIYMQCNELLRQESFSTRNLLRHFRVEMLGTTDDPCDDLLHHRKIQEEGFEIKVLPSFRPDKIFQLQNKPLFLEYLQKLEQCSGISIFSFDNLILALEKRVDYFHEQGCRLADHGLRYMPPVVAEPSSLENEFRDFLLKKDKVEFSAIEEFTGLVLRELCSMYHARGWVQQFHLGAMRNNNSRLIQKLGADAGADSIGDYPQAENLSAFLDALDREDRLAKTILYNLNPADSELFCTLCGNFNDGKIRGKMQYGAAWWFLDQQDGIEKQLNTLSTMGMISPFIGMITDSRSFLSYSRHEYFRRILCNFFGTRMDLGLLPRDEKWIGGIVRNICYYNAKEYLQLS